MSRKYRRIHSDIEILVAMQDVFEITEEMDLLDDEIVQEVIAALEQDELRMRRIAHLLKIKNPKLSNIAIMSEGGHMKIVLLFEDKTGIVVGRRRTQAASIRNLIRLAS